MSSRDELFGEPIMSLGKDWVGRSQRVNGTSTAQLQLIERGADALLAEVTGEATKMGMNVDTSRDPYVRVEARNDGATPGALHVFVKVWLKRKAS